MNSTSKDQWLQTFFSSPNRIQWSSNELKSDSDLDMITREANVWIQSEEEKEFKRPILLPLCENKDVSWYACCQNAQQKNQIIEELNSFVNTTYSHMDQGYILDETHPCESALISQFQTNILKIDVHEKCNEKFHDTLRLYRKLIALRPIKDKLLIQSPGRLRRNFEQSLLAQNEPLALRCMEDLKNTGNLDQQNQRFLDIRFKSVFGKWDLLAHDPWYLRSVIDIPLPTRIQQDLLEAIYFSDLFKFELENNPNGAIDTFKSKIRPFYTKLFKSRRGIKSGPVIKAFLLFELSKDKTDYSYCESILSDYSKDDDGYAYAEILLGMISEEDKSASIVEQADEAFEEEDFDLALALFLKTEKNKNSFKKILYCTFEIRTLKTFVTVWNYSQKIPLDIIDSLPPKSRKLYSELKEKNEQKQGYQIDNWVELFRYVLDKKDENHACVVAEQGAIEWDNTKFLLSTDQINTLSELLFDCFDSNSNFIKKIYPLFYESILNCTSIQNSYKPIYLRMIEIITYFETIESTNLSIIHELIGIVFEFGVSTKEYKDIVAGLLSILEKKDSYSELTWIFDIAELIAIYPRLEKNLSIVFINTVGTIVAKNSHRLNEREWAVVQTLAIDFNMVDHFESLRPSIPADDVKDKDRIDLSGKKIGIYTLTEQAGLRAKNILKQIYDGVDVETNCDHAASERLINLAKSSDVFVFAWKSSKHQAYYCVKDNIKISDNLVMPLGKGSSSIVNSVTKFIDSHF